MVSWAVLCCVVEVCRPTASCLLRPSYNIALTWQGVHHSLASSCSHTVVANWLTVPALVLALLLCCWCWCLAAVLVQGCLVGSLCSYGPNVAVLQIDCAVLLRCAAAVVPRYKDVKWLVKERRWPPALTDSLQAFLQLRSI
jgi:hypothetical protein